MVYPLPRTVTDTDPCGARFTLRTTLKLPLSTENALDKLPTSTPIERTSLLVPSLPCTVWHVNDVSETHLLPSHPVLPTRLLLVNPLIPIPAPCTVKDTDPVFARFCLCSTLSPTTSTDQASVRLPPVCPAVNTTRRVPCAAGPDRHCTEVSELHSVPRHAVKPSRTLAVCPETPKPDPSTLIVAFTAALRVPRFIARVRLNCATSNDQTCVWLPVEAPTVMIVRLDPCAP